VVENAENLVEGRILNIYLPGTPYFVGHAGQGPGGPVKRRAVASTRASFMWLCKVALWRLNASDVHSPKKLQNFWISADFLNEIRKHHSTCSYESIGAFYLDFSKLRCDLRYEPCHLSRSELSVLQVLAL